MSWRKGLATHSKFKNVYGEPYKKDRSYENVKLSKNAWDGGYCAVNPKFLAVVLDTSGGGGAFLVIPLTKYGQQRADNPRVVGHQREVLDLQWNPFNDQIIASASEDTTVKIWRIPQGGLTEDLLDPLVDLRGHQRKVGLIRWHPTANGIIASAAFDFKVIVWNALKARVLCTVDGHRDTIYDLAFNYNGTRMVTTSKDKKVRLINPRTGNIEREFIAHGSPKPSHVAFSDKTGDRIVTTGFSTSGERTISLWDLTDAKPMIKSSTIDNSSGVLMLYYDIDINVAYVAGKGDGMICYYEVMKEEPFLFRLSEYRHSTPQKSLGKMCKRGLDTTKCEIFRFYKLHPNNWIEPIPMICPRRSDEFQDDIYPPTTSMQPALTAEEWISGVDKQPNLMSLKDGASIGSTTAGGGGRSTSGISTADKLNSNFNRPAKFEKQLSKESMLSNDVIPRAQSPVKKTVQHDVQAEQVEQALHDLEKQKQQNSQQSKEIEALKRALATKDTRISELERHLAAKNDLSAKMTQLTDLTERLTDDNERLAAVNDHLTAVNERLTKENERLTAASDRYSTSNADSRRRAADEERSRLPGYQSLTSTRRTQVDEAVTTSLRNAKSPLDDLDLDKAFDEPTVQPTKYSRVESSVTSWQKPVERDFVDASRTAQSSRVESSWQKPADKRSHDTQYSRVESSWQKPADKRFDDVSHDTQYSRVEMSNTTWQKPLGKDFDDVSRSTQYSRVESGQLPAVRPKYAMPKEDTREAEASVGLESSVQDYSIDDIEAELERLREDLARTRAKPSYSGGGMARASTTTSGSSQAHDAPARNGSAVAVSSSVKTGTGSGGTAAYTEMAGSTSGGAVSSSGRAEIGSKDAAPSSGRSGSRRMVITTASFARSPGSDGERKGNFYQNVSH